MKTFLFLAAFIHVVCVNVWAQNVSTLRLNDGLDCSGVESEPVPNAVPNLNEVIGWGGRVESMNETGMWIFYDTIDYGLEDWSCILKSYTPTARCLLHQGCFGDPYQSFRVMGDPNDFSKETITFYELDAYRGAQEYVEEDTAQLSISIASIIITAASPWTIYNEPNYGGQSACLNIVDSFFTATLDTLYISPPFPHGTIASVKKGCLSSNIHVPQGPVEKDNAWVIENYNEKK